MFRTRAAVTVSGNPPLPEAVPQGADAVDELSGRTLMSGGLWVVGAQALPQIYVIVQSVIVARFLSVTDMGNQSFIAFMEISVVAICSFGLSGALSRYGGELLGEGRFGTLRGLVWWTAKLHVVGALLAAGVMVVASFFSAPSLRDAWLWVAMAAAFATFNNVPTSVLSILRRWKDASLIGLTFGALQTVILIAVLAAGGGLPAVFAVLAVLTAAATLVACLIARRVLNRVAPTTEPHHDFRGPMLRYSAVVFGGFLLTFVVLRRSEFFFLERYSTPAAIAFYSIAFAVTAGLAACFEAFTSIVSPTVASLTGAGEAYRIRDGFSRALRLVIQVAVPICALAFVFAPAVIRLLYGSAYDATGPPLRIMLTVFPLFALMLLCTGILWGTGKPKVWLYAFLTASVVDISLDFLLIPPHGADGAAVANASAQAVASIIVVAYTLRAFGPVDWQARALLRAIAIAVIAALAGWNGLSAIAGVGGVVAGLVSALLVYLTLPRLIGIVPATDAAWISQAFSGRFGRLISRAVNAAVYRPKHVEERVS